MPWRPNTCLPNQRKFKDDVAELNRLKRDALIEGDNLVQLS